MPRLIYPSQGTHVNDVLKVLKYKDRDTLADEFVLPLYEKIVNNHVDGNNTSGVSITRILALKFWIKPIPLNPPENDDMFYKGKQELEMNEDLEEQI